MAKTQKRRLPTDEQALSGIPVALGSASKHLECADVLAERGFTGQARSLLILSIEESEKARTLGQIALGEPLTESEALARLYTHTPRYRGALRKSWSGGATGTYVAESLRERLRMKPKRTEAQRWSAALASHPEALPLDWADVAAVVREAGLYVDIGDDGRWHSPADVPLGEYEALRPTAVHLLRRMTAAYHRELQARGPDIAFWRPLPPLPSSQSTEPTQGIATDRYIVERLHHQRGWLAWTDRAGVIEPIRYVGWTLDRSDNAFSDDASGLMVLSHAILSDALGSSRSFDDEYRDDRGDKQLLWRRFFEEKLVTIPAGRRWDISRAEVLSWSGADSISRASSGESTS